MDEIIEVKEGDLNIEMGIQILPETNEDEPDLMSDEEKAEFIRNTSITWLKDDVKLLEHDPKVDRLFQFVYDKLDGSHRLIVRKATKETEGVYTCLVENDSGTSSCSTQLIVGPGNLPKLTSGLEDVTVYVGQRLEFRVRSSGSPPIDSCQWFKDGHLIIECKSSQLNQRIVSQANSRVGIICEKQQDTSSHSTNQQQQQLLFRLSIENLKLDDAGQYKCRVINQFGYDETQCHVRVLQEVIEEHEEIEEQIEQTMRLGGGSESHMETQEETEETISEQRQVKRAKLTSESKNEPKFVRHLQDKILIDSSETRSDFDELWVSTEVNESSDSSDKLKVRWFMNDDIEIVSTSSTSEYQVDNFYEQNEHEIKHRLRLNKRNKLTTRRSSVLATSEATNKISCIASNQFGKCQTSCQLKRLAKPQFLRLLEDVETQTEKTIVLSVLLDESDDSIKPQDVQFYSNEKELIYSSKRDGDQKEIYTQNGSRILIKSLEKIIDLMDEEGRGKGFEGRRSSVSSQRRQARLFELTIDRCQVEHSGLWLCRAQNEAGQTQTQAEVEIYKEPKLVSDLPDSVRVEPGREMRLKVEASGFPRPVFSWFKDQLGIAEEENRVFTEETTTIETSETTTETTSSIKSRRSSVSSTPNDKGIEIIGETLIIRDARAEDAGLYKCRIENRLGECETRDCKLTIVGHGDDSAGEAPKISKDLSQSSLLEVDEGENVILRVLAQGQPRPEAHWLKDGQQIDQLNQMKQGRRSSRLESQVVGQEYELKIKRTRQSDSAKYKLVLRNQFGQVESKTVELVVRKRATRANLPEEAPTISMESQDKVVGLDSTVSFDLELAGQPKPFVTWFKNGRRLTESSDGRVTFLEEQSTTSTKSIERQIELVPIEHERSTYIHRLIIKNVRDTDEAIYSCKAENDLGSCKSSLVSLTVDKRRDASDEVLEREEREKASKVAIEEQITAQTTTTTVTTTDATSDVEDANEEEEFNKVITTKKTTTTTTTTTTTHEEEQDELSEDVEETEKVTETEESLRREEEQIGRQRQLENEKTRTKRKTTTTTTKTNTQTETDQDRERANRPKQTDSSTQEDDETMQDEEIIEELEEEEEELLSESERRERKKQKQKQRHQEHDQIIERQQIKDNKGKQNELIEEITTTKREHLEKTLDTVQEAKPHLVSLPKEVVGAPGSSPAIVTEVAGKPTPQISWLKDGKPISDTQLRSKHLEIMDLPTDKPDTLKQALKINDLRLTDTGQYQIVANNDQGQVKSETIELKTDRRMSVVEKPIAKPALGVNPQDIEPDLTKPQVLSTTQTVKAGPGSSPLIPVEISGKPEPQLEWLKDGKPISEDILRDDGHLEIVPLESDKPDTIKQALKINDIKPSDVGNYQVRVKNPLGQVESEPTNVRLDRRMSSLEKPLEDGKAQIEEKPTREEQVPMDTTQSESPIPEDEQVAPTIVSVPEEIVAGKGASPEIVAQVTGKPEPKLTWFKDGQEITQRDLDSGHLEIVDLPTKKPDTIRQALRINDLKPNDAAAYHVKAENPAGEVDSEPTNVRLDRSMEADDKPQVTGAIPADDEETPMDLDEDRAPETRAKSAVGAPVERVRPVAPEIISQPKEVVAAVGSNPVLETEIAGEPEAQVTWLKDGQPIPDRLLRENHLEPTWEPVPEKPGVMKHVLKVNDLRPSDVADYSVKAQNPLGETESEPIKLKTDRSMSRSDAPKVTKAHEQDDEAAPQDASSEPSDKPDQFAPEILSAPQEVKAGLSSSPELEAKVAGQPQPQVTWLKDGEPLPARLLRDGHLEPSEEPVADEPGVVKHVLKVNDMRPSDAAHYTIKAQNPIGETQSEPIKLKLDRSMSKSDAPNVVAADQDSGKIAPEESGSSVAPKASQFAPKILSVPKEIKAGMGSSPEIEARVSGQPEPEVTWLKDGQPIPERLLLDGHFEPTSESVPEQPGVSKHVLKVNDMRPSDGADYTLKAKNPLGEAESEPIKLKMDRRMSSIEQPVVEKADQAQTEAAQSKPDSEHLAPEILSSPEEIVAGAGSSPVVETLVAGPETVPTDSAEQKPKATWLKDGEPIPARLLRDGHLEPTEEPVPDEPGVVKHALKINDMNPSDVGDYALKLETPQGEEVQSAPTKVKLDRSMSKSDKPIVVASERDDDQTKAESDEPTRVAKPGDFAPEIVSIPEEIVSGVGSSPQIQAIVSGKPLPETTWFKDGQPIDQSDLNSGHLEVVDLASDQPDTKKQALKINNLRPMDVAAYHVKAQNPLGDAESEPTNLRLDRSMGPNDEPKVISGQQAQSSDAAPSRKMQAPKIRRIPSRLSAPQGSNPSIEVEISGEPVPEVIWLRNGVVIDKADAHFTLAESPDRGLYSLTINNVQPKDEAVYSVRAINEVGQVDSAPVELKVTPSDQCSAKKPTGLAPKIVKLPKEIVAPLKSSPSIQVQIESLGEEKSSGIVWLKDGKAIDMAKSGDKFSVSENKIKPDVICYTLTINDLQKSDLTQYVVCATNPFGRVESSPINVIEEDSKVSKKLAQAPKIKRLPARLTAPQGSNPVIEAEIGGEPAPEVVWLRNGVLIDKSDVHFAFGESPVEGVYSLTIKNVQVDDEAVYSLRAINPIDTVDSSPVELKVTPSSVAGAKLKGEAPKIVKIPSEIWAPLKSSPSIQVEIESTGSEPAQITWLKDGKAMDIGKIGDKFTISDTKIKPNVTCYTLTINDLQKADLTQYVVCATNPFGSVESNPIEVLEAPKKPMRAPMIKRMPRRIVAAVGSNPVIEVEISGEPKPEIVWYKNGRRLHSVKNHISFLELGSGVFKLQFTNLKATDQAEYSFVATNDAGKIESEPISLIVDGAMKPEQEPFVQQASELPTQHSVQAALFEGPLEAPQIFGLEDRESLPGETVKLEAQVTGSPRPQIKWLKDGDQVEINMLNQVPDSNKHSLTLKNVNDLYDGVYSLEATNLAGTTRKDATVRVVDTLTQKPLQIHSKAQLEPSEPIKRKPQVEERGDKPHIKRGLKFSQVNQGRSIKFEVQVDGAYEEVIWMKDGQQINLPQQNSILDQVDSDEESASLCASDQDDKSLNLDHDQQFSGRPSDGKRKLGAKILVKPRNILAGAKSRIVLECKVSGQPRPEIIWFKDGQRVVIRSENEAKYNIEEEQVEEISTTTTSEPIKQYWSRFVIEDLDSSDVGSYELLTQNAFGSEKCAPVSLELDERMVATDDCLTTTNHNLTSSEQLKRAQAPQILAQPQSIEAPRNSRVAFQVQVCGQPKPLVNWFRDGKLISETSDGHVSIREYSNGIVRLILDKISPTDEGQFEARAQNKLGSVKTIPVTLTLDEEITSTTTSDLVAPEPNEQPDARAQLSAARAPRILLRPRRVLAKPTHKLQLEVSVSGQSKPSIVWYKDGKRVEAKTIVHSDGSSETLTTSSSERVEIHKISDSYEKLVIHSLESADQGKYTVSAENSFGVAMSEPAHVLLADSEEELIEEEQTTTSVTTTTTKETDERGPSDFFERFVNDGTFKGFESCDRREKPGFKLRPRNRKAPVGAKIDFEVEVTGEPKPDVIWFKNGRRLHFEDDGRVRVEHFSDGGSRLVIDDVHETDHGLYAAQATNELGSERTEQVQLRVTKRTQVSEISQVTQADWRTRVTRHTKKTRDHYTFSEEKRFGYVSMTLEDAQLDHDGDYRLIVRNKWGEASTQAPLVVIPRVEPRSGFRQQTERDFDASSLSGRSSRSNNARRTPMDQLEDFGHELDKSVGMFGSESKYQSGEDTYLLQLRDTEFPLRLRKYLRFGARQSPSLRSNLMDAHWGAGARVSVRERRKFREVMDEEIDDERAGLDTRNTPLRLQKEVGTCGHSAAALEHLRVEAAERVARKSAEPDPLDSSAIQMMPPFFREKLKDSVVEEHSTREDCLNEALFACLAAGEPAPEYTWFRNDIIITPDTDKRLNIETTSNGGSLLRICEPRLYDAGCFKCVARNPHGDVTTRARLRLATRPSRPEPAEIVAANEHQVLLNWKPPRDFDVNCAQVLGYRLEMSQSSLGQSDHWLTLAADIGHQFYLVDDLTPSTSYSFRLSARNKFGWSESSYSTYVTTSAASSGARLQMAYEQRARQCIADICDPLKLRHCEDQLSLNMDYNIEQDPIRVNGLNGEQKWLDSGVKLQAEISRGRFSLIAKAIATSTALAGKSLAVKIVPAKLQQEAQTKNEFDLMRSLQHEKIVQLYMAYKDDDKFIFLQERLSGLDVLTYLCSFNSYNEELVSKILIQVMDAIEYLHFRGMCLLELLPDNVVMTNGRSTSIKLVDFSAARFVPRSGARVPLNVSQNLEYCPPEVAAGHEVNTASDVWCIGVLAYVLLSGHSPFKGQTEEETRENVLLGRYKYDHLYPNCTPEVTRFLINVFKKHSSKRPTIEQLYENKWLLPNEMMIKKRQQATFRSDKILQFAEEFHRNKLEQQAQNQDLLSQYLQ